MSILLLPTPVGYMQFTKLIWRDGRPYSDIYDDIYYSSAEDEAIPGESEFNHVFLKNNGLPQRWLHADNFVIAELGFGSGLNCALTIREWLKHCADSKKKKTLHYIAIEKHPLSADAIADLLSPHPELEQICEQLVDNYPPAIAATHSRSLFDNRVVIHYKFMDVDDALDNEALAVDAWYLDGFSPAKNPEMWSQQVCAKIVENSRAGATCSTYTAAGFVKRNLLKAGFVVHKVPGHGNKREMLAAELPVIEGGDNEPASLRYKDKPWFQRPSNVDVSKKTATIIGAGVAGLSLAYALVQRGWSVSIIDKHGDIAKEASSNPAPIVYPRLSVNNETDSEYYNAAYCYALYLFNKLQKKSRERFWFGGGLLQLMDKNRIEQIIQKYEFNSDYITIAEVQVDDKVMVDYTSAGVVLPAILCGVLREECADALNIIEAEITGIRSDGNSWQCFSGSEVVNDNELLLIANGVEINSVGLPIDFPVEKIRGQVAVLDACEASGKINKTLNAEVHITPAINGKHYLGATYTRGNSDPAIVPGDSRALLESLENIYPHMFTEEDCSAAWVGFRSIAKDRVPVVGAVPDVSFFDDEYADIRHGNNVRSYLPASYLDGLYVSAAHGSRGFTSSFISAEIIASLIEGSPMPVSKKVLDYISPSRFVVNDLKRR